MRSWLPLLPSEAAQPPGDGRVQDLKQFFQSNSKRPKIIIGYAGHNLLKGMEPHMHLPDAEARRFIRQYQQFLQFCLPQKLSAKDLQQYDKNPLMALADARQRFDTERQLLDEYLSSGAAMDEDIRTAIATMQIDRWIYLKDTAHYSVLLSEDGLAGYGVLGLTDRLRDVAGGSGQLIEAGILHLQGQYVCDNLVRHVVWLGPGIRRDMQQGLQDLKKEQKFYR